MPKICYRPKKFNDDRKDKIAKANKDKFRYRVDLEPWRDGSVRYIFVAEETDNHTFVDGQAFSLREAVTEADGGVVTALALWGYKEPK